MAVQNIGRLLHYELHEEQFDDQTSLKTLFDKVRPKIPMLKGVEPLLELDRDEKKFDIFLTFHRSSLLVSDLKIFLPFTINLDPYIKKVIKEEYHQNIDDDTIGIGARGAALAAATPVWDGTPTEWTTPNPRPALTHRRPLRQPQVLRPPPLPLYGTWGPPSWTPDSYNTLPTTYIAPVTPLPAEVLETKLSALTVPGVCQLFEKIEDLTPNSLSQYTNVIKMNNINGRVLLHCDMDELKKVLKITFGDWEMFRVLIVSLREHELTVFTRQDEGVKSVIRFKNENNQKNNNSSNSNTSRDIVPRERKTSNPKIEIENKSSRGSNKQTLMEKQVTLEEQMICGALQTLNEEACEDVLELEEGGPTEPPLVHTALIPPSPETPQQETEFVVLAGWRGGRWAPVGSGGPSEASSTCSTPRATHKPLTRPNSLVVEPTTPLSCTTNAAAAASSLEKLTKLKDKLPQKPVTLDSDDESTPLVSDDMSTPSISLAINQQFSSPEAEHNKDDDITDSTDFSPVSPLHISNNNNTTPTPAVGVSGGLSASLLSMDNICVAISRSGSTSSGTLSRQNALDNEERL